MISCTRTADGRKRCLTPLPPSDRISKQSHHRHNIEKGIIVFWDIKKKKKEKKIQADRAETATIGKCTQPVLPSDSFASKAHRKALQKCLLQRKAPISFSVDYVPLIARCCPPVCINPVRGPSAGLFPSLHRNSKPQHILSR